MKENIAEETIWVVIVVDNEKEKTEIEGDHAKAEI